MLDGPEGHHAATVQRLAVGEAIELVDGRGRRAAGVVTVAAVGRLEIRVDAVSRDADAPVVLVQALAKGGRDESAIEFATEMGVTRVIPWAAQRSVAQWRGEKAVKGRSAWEACVAAAAKQSRRAWTPEVSPLVTSRELATHIAEAVAAGADVALLREDAHEALADRVWAARSSREVWVIVGPEGGISAGEVLAFEDAGAESLRLGPHVLRAGTAGPAAIAAIAALSGAWSSRPVEPGPVG